MKNSKTNELERFLSIHEQLYVLTLSLLNSVVGEVFSNIPIQTDVMFLGSRVNKINIGSLLRH